MLNDCIDFKIISRCVLIAAVTFVIFKMLAQPYRLSGDCMEPAIKDGGLYFLNKISSYFNQYQIGDIIVFKYEDKDWVARIVALENDSIKIGEQNIIVNNIELHDKVLRNWIDWEFGTCGVDQTIKVPSGHVYVLSDNLSAHHDDSRVFGPISYSLIVGILW